MIDQEKIAAEAAAQRLAASLDPERVDALLADAEASGTPIDGPNGLLAGMTKAVLERAVMVSSAGSNSRWGAIDDVLVLIAGPLHVGIGCVSSLDGRHTPRHRARDRASPRPPEGPGQSRITLQMQVWITLGTDSPRRHTSPLLAICRVSMALRPALGGHVHQPGQPRVARGPEACCRRETLTLGPRPRPRPRRSRQRP